MSNLVEAHLELDDEDYLSSDELNYDEEVDNNSEILNEIKDIKEDFSNFVNVQKDVQQEQEMMKEELLTVMRDSDGDVSYEEILISINENLIESNSYLYTINIYFSGFFIAMILYFITKSLIGFFKPFL